MPYFWLSFADPKRPKDQQFLGVCIINTDEYDGPFARPIDSKDNEFSKAVTYAYAKGLNPGGSVKGFRIGDEYLIHSDIKTVVNFYKDRLLTREECSSLDEILLTIQKRLGLP
jgi:hypothetical protein